MTHDGDTPPSLYSDQGENKRKEGRRKGKGMGGEGLGRKGNEWKNKKVHFWRRGNICLV